MENVLRHPDPRHDGVLGDAGVKVSRGDGVISDQIMRQQQITSDQFRQHSVSDYFHLSQNQIPGTPGWKLQCKQAPAWPEHLKKVIIIVPKKRWDWRLEECHASRSCEYFNGLLLVYLPINSLSHLTISLTRCLPPALSLVTDSALWLADIPDQVPAPGPSSAVQHETSLINMVKYFQRWVQRKLDKT